MFNEHYQLLSIVQRQGHRRGWGTLQDPRYYYFSCRFIITISIITVDSLVCTPRFLLENTFQMYVDDIAWQYMACFYAYGDDQQIYISSDASNQAGMESAMTTLEAGIAEVRPSMAANRFQVNDAKTEFLAVLSEQNNRAVPGLRIGHDIITPSHPARNLGAHSDSCVSVESQVKRSADPHISIFIM